MLSLKCYQQVLLFLFFSASAVIGIILVLIFIPYAIPIQSLQRSVGQATPAFLIVVLAGTMGAFFSSLQRLYEFKELPQILYAKKFSKDYDVLFVYSLVPALVGCMAAAVLYLIFAGGLLSGSLFPTFKCKHGQCADFGALLGDYGPEQAFDYAKAILWGFIAGFAERLVPSLLNGFAQDATKGDAASLQGSPGQGESVGEHSSSEAGRIIPMRKTALEIDGHPTPTIASRGMANEM